MDMNSVATWIGDWLGKLPGWLFWPALIVIIVLAAIMIFYAETPVFFRSKRVDLGEKNDKK